VLEKGCYFSPRLAQVVLDPTGRILGKGKVMIDQEAYQQLRAEIEVRTASDRLLLDKLRKDVRPLVSRTKRIHPRSATSVSLVATDGGNNSLRFDPFMVQVVRVVDSNDNELCLEVVTPTTPILELDARQFDASGKPATSLGRLMVALKVHSLPKLSHFIRPDDEGLPRSATIVQVYRELVEWAVLYDLLKMDFGSDTIIVFDGDLRSKAFAGELFIEYGKLLKSEIERHAHQRRAVFLVGVMKSSTVLSRYRLAFALEGILRGTYPAYIEVPYELEKEVYQWEESYRGEDRVVAGRERNKFVLGKMFFAKFGSRSRDPIWPVDILSPQAVQADRIFGHLLADAIEGFPVPFYPRCLQKAHERAALVDFDMDMLQDAIFNGLRRALGKESTTLDAFVLEDADPGQGRYR
jgi:hypothetical protein